MRQHLAYNYWIQNLKGIDTERSKNMKIVEVLVFKNFERGNMVTDFGAQLLYWWGFLAFESEYYSRLSS
jgi:hypothetical protein